MVPVWTAQLVLQDRTGVPVVSVTTCPYIPGTTGKSHWQNPWLGSKPVLAAAACLGPRVRAEGDLPDLPAESHTLEFSTASAPPSPQWERVQEANLRGSCSLSCHHWETFLPGWHRGAVGLENDRSEGAGKRAHWKDGSDPHWSFWRGFGSSLPLEGEFSLFS